MVICDNCIPIIVEFANSLLQVCHSVDDLSGDNECIMYMLERGEVAKKHTYKKY